MRWRRERWVKLYVKEEGSFAQLPLYVRALGAMLLKISDADGRICLRDKPPWEAVAFQLGADASDRRLLRKHIPILIADGYLSLSGDSLVVRNFAAAQVGATGDSSSSAHESDANQTRAAHEPDASGARAGHEPSATSEPSNQNSSVQAVRGEEKRGEERWPATADQRRRAALEIWAEFQAERQSAAQSIGQTAPRLPSTDKGFDELVIRIRELVVEASETLDAAAARCRHVVARASFEARRDRRMDWFGGKTWTKAQFDMFAARPLERRAPLAVVREFDAMDFVPRRDEVA
jgi:hypothetical protein